MDQFSYGKSPSGSFQQFDQRNKQKSNSYKIDFFRGAIEIDADQSTKHISLILIVELYFQLYWPRFYYSTILRWLFDLRI